MPIMLNGQEPPFKKEIEDNSDNQPLNVDFQNDDPVKNNPDKYPTLYEFTRPMYVGNRHTLGRQSYIDSIEAAFHRPEYSNALLLGDAGVGKTAIVEELVRQNPQRRYYVVDLGLMSAPKGTGSDGVNEMIQRISKMFDEILHLQARSDQETVLFIDEIHRLAQKSDAPLDAFKEKTARSGQLGLRILGATTYDEYNQYLKGNEAFIERFQSLKIAEPDFQTTVQILKDMKKKVAPNAVMNDSLFHRMVNISNQYMPSQAQPRKSIRLFDGMLGWHLSKNLPLNEPLLAMTMYRGYGIRIDWQVDVDNLEAQLNSHVIDQTDATYILCQRLYMSIADFVDDSRPQGSFLFTGSTGVGKTELAKQLTTALFGTSKAMIRFDMTEFATKDTVNLFRTELAERVSNQPNCVLLLDEIEKADVSVRQLLLQVLDDARLSDRYQNTVSFANAYIVMTTNSASNVYEQLNPITDNQKTDGHGQWVQKFRELIRGTLESDGFPPELIGRLDEFIPFKPLNRPAQRQIALLALRKFTELVADKYGVELHYDARLPYYLVDEHYNQSTKAGGARSLMQRIDQEIKAKVAEYVIKYPKTQKLAITVNGSMKIYNKSQFESGAYLVVQPYQEPKLDDDNNFGRSRRWERGY